jgi:hypothetical protein
MDDVEKQLLEIEENLHKWFKEKWVRFGPDGKIRGQCAREKSSEGKPKCRPLKSAQAMGKKGRAKAARRKRREDPNPDRSGKAKNVKTESDQMDELKCWKGYTRVQGVPAGAPASCKKKTEESTMENINENHICPICGGELVSELLMNEKKDACYYKVKSRYKVWPSAYASGALVKCRKKGAKNWGTKSEGVEELDEKWSEKYKRSIDCSHPKGFSQKAHCQGRKKNEETLMKEEQLKNIIREMVEEMYNEQNQIQDECWECYEAAMEEGTNEAYEECYRKTNWEMVPEGEEHTCEGDEFYEIYGDINADAKENLAEAEYRGRKVKLGKPMRGDVKKFKVFVRNPTTGKVKKVNFGDKKMRIKKSNPKRRKSFRARHNCANPGPHTKARYWSCRKW